MCLVTENYIISELQHKTLLNYKITPLRYKNIFPIWGVFFTAKQNLASCVLLLASCLLCVASLVAICHILLAILLPIRFTVTLHTSGLILAGMLANSGEEANVVSSSTASVSGLAASAHRWRFSSVKSWSSAWNHHKQHNIYNHSSSYCFKITKY